MFSKPLIMMKMYTIIFDSDYLRTLSKWRDYICKDMCCNMGENDTIGKIELNPSFILSDKSANSRNDIQ